MTRSMLHVNTAAVGRLHPRAASRIAELAAGLASSDFYTSVYPQLAVEIERAREGAARLLGVPPESIALTPSTSDGIAAFLAGLTLEPGDLVALARGSFISVPVALLRLQQQGVKVMHVGTEQGRVTPADLASTPARTRLIIIDWVNYWSGTRNDMQPLVDFCRRANIPLLIDGVQGLGAAPLDFDFSAVAGFACGGHKWLRGPEGTGFLYVAPSMLARLTPRHLGYRSLVSPTRFEADHLELSSDTRVFEVGTMNTLGIAGLGAVLSQLLEEGPNATSQRVRETADEIYRFLGTLPDVELITPAAASERAGIVSFRHRTAGPEVIWQQLSSAGLTGGTRRGCVRLSASADISSEAVIAALGRALDR